MHDFFAPFEEQVIYKKVEENAILYEVGFDEYLNFSKLGVLNLIINGNFIDLDANKKNRVLGDFINLLLVILLLITW